MHVSPDPVTTLEQAARERGILLDFIGRGLYCTRDVSWASASGESRYARASAGCWPTTSVMKPS